jgi:putative protease
MKIVAPISHPEETEMLLHYGADELYCGIAASKWQSLYGDKLWMNRRNPVGANISSIKDMSQIAELSHKKGVEVYVAFNSPFYPPESLNYILHLCEKLVFETQIDGLVVSDLNLLILLSGKNLPVKIHLSSIANCINSEAAEFYLFLGVTRIILPRHMILSEIEALVKNMGKKIEFEVFAVNDGCYFEEGFCQTSHSMGGPFCMTQWKANPLSNSKKNLSYEKISESLKDLREVLWYQNNCGCSFQSEGLPNGPCSLCWFGLLKEFGVKAVKIAGREASFYRKMRSLQMVKEVISHVNSGAASESIAKFAKKMRNTPKFCKKGYMCYFREN